MVAGGQVRFAREWDEGFAKREFAEGPVGGEIGFFEFDGGHFGSG